MTNLLDAAPEQVYLDTLFDYQFNRLVEEGLNPSELEPLRRHIPQGNVRRGNGIIPFLIIPQWKISISRMMLKIRYEGTGVTYINTGLVDVVESPKGHYLAIDFEDGENYQGRGSFECHQEFKAQGRLSATVREGITAFILFPQIIDRHKMDLPGSRYEGMIPFIDRSEGLYMLRYGHSKSTPGHPGHGSASCGQRLEV